jgi:hypothetical protein
MTERRRLTPAERLACIGAAVILASMLLPWYGIPFSGLSVTGFDAFGFAAAALLVVAGAAVVAVMREAAGRPPARPLRTAELVALAGLWAALIDVYLILDPPDELGGTTDVSARLGAFVALGGCVAMAVAGMRMRAERHAAERSR